MSSVFLTEFGAIVVVGLLGVALVALTVDAMLTKGAGGVSRRAPYFLAASHPPAVRPVTSVALVRVSASDWP